MHIGLSTTRSLLFAPASRPDLVSKLPRSRPDLAAIDLEDGIAEAARPAARRDVAAMLGSLAEQVAVACVRVSTHFGEDAELDLAAIAAARPAALVVPKAERPDLLAEFAARVDQHRLPDACGLIVGIETARGVATVFDLLVASERVIGVYFGAEDFVSSMGGRRTIAGAEVAHARARVVLAARTHDCFALDQALSDFRDEQAFRIDADAGRDYGYDGKLCIHPAQVAIANDVFGATPNEIERARRIVGEYDASLADGDAAPVIDGCLVDEAVVRRFRPIAALAVSDEQR